MTIHAFQSIYKSLTAFTLVAVITACGGGGSGGSKTPTPDTTPDALTIAAVNNAAVSADVTSAPVTISGINQATSISIVGGTYSIAGAVYTDVAGTVTNGQAITVKVKTSDKTNTAVTATLTIGGVNGQFKVTTAPDVTPDAFTFTDVKDVAPKSVNTSTAITVAGVDVAVPISITGGEYSINDGAFTSTAGTVSNGQAVKVHVTASDKVSTDAVAVLTIGGADKAVSANYKVTTFADTVAPTAQILFPPPVSMTEGNTILVRGSASDDYSTVKSVTVNGVPATTTDGYKNWQASVSLTAASSTDVTVTTKDSAENESTNAAKVVITQGDYKNAFPNANFKLTSPWAIVHDKLDGRDRLLISDGNNIFSIDPETGNRSVMASSAGSDALAIDPISKRLYGANSERLFYIDFSETLPVPHDVLFYSELSLYVSALAIDDSGLNSKVLVVGSYTPQLYIHNVSATTFSLFSDAATALPNTENPLFSPRGAAFDKKNNRYLVVNGGQDKDVSKHAIIAVDKTTGARTVLSSNTVGTGELFTAVLPSENTNFISGIVIDEKNNRAIVSECLTGTFFTVDLTNGNRQKFSDSSQAGAINPINFVGSLMLSDSGAYVFAVDNDKHGIYAVDIVTGQRVIFSKSESQY